MMEHFYEQKKKLSYWILYLGSRIFKNERKIKTFGETELSEFTTI